MPPMPTLIIVSGKPGSGKSTLARRLAAEDALWLPLVSCDPVRYGLRRTGVESGGGIPVELFYGNIGYLLDAGVSLIAELSFRRGLDEARLRPLVDRYRVVNFHCDIAIEEARRRFIARQSARVAPTSADTIVAAMARGTFDWTVFEPLDIVVPRLHVDTSAGYAPDLATIVAFCEEHGRASTARS